MHPALLLVFRFGKFALTRQRLGCLLVKVGFFYIFIALFRRPNGISDSFDHVGVPKEALWLGQHSSEVALIVD